MVSNRVSLLLVSLDDFVLWAPFFAHIELTDSLFKLLGDLYLSSSNMVSLYQERVVDPNAINYSFIVGSCRIICDSSIYHRHNKQRVDGSCKCHISYAYV